MDTPTLDYRTASVKSDAVSRPKLWVLLLLIAIWFSGAVGGESIWPWLHQPGKDPQQEMAAGMSIGFLLFAIVCIAGFKRLWRFSLVHAICAFLIGFLSTVGGIVWALVDRGWHWIP